MLYTFKALYFTLLVKSSRQLLPLMSLPGCSGRAGSLSFTSCLWETEPGPSPGRTDDGRWWRGSCVHCPGPYLLPRGRPPLLRSQMGTRTVFVRQILSLRVSGRPVLPGSPAQFSPEWELVWLRASVNGLSSQAAVLGAGLGGDGGSALPGQQQGACYAPAICSPLPREMLQSPTPAL